MTSSSSRFALKARTRQLFGKKTKKLRKQGLVPATVYGHEISPISIELDYKELVKIFGRTGETELLNLAVEGESKNRPVLIHQEQKDPVTGKLLHLEFLQVSLMEKVTAAVPLVFVGEAKAQKEGVGVLLELLHEIEVEALPQDLPSSIEVKVSDLSEIRQVIKVSDLILPKGVVVKANPDELVCKIVEQQKEEEKPTPAVSETAIPETPAEAPASETAAPASPEEPKGKEKKEKK